MNNEDKTFEGAPDPKFAQAADEVSIGDRIRANMDQHGVNERSAPYNRELLARRLDELEARQS